MTRRLPQSAHAAALLAVGWIGIAAIAAGAELDEARQLLLRGRYAEASERYVALAEQHPVAAALGQARAKTATGEADEAVAILTAAAEQHGDDADLRAELAWLALERGDHDAADHWTADALEQDGDCLAARWVQAELLRLSGKLDEAQAAYGWFVDYYNANEIDDADSLRWIGLAAAQYARWKRLTDQFTFLVNELYPDALELDPNYWPAAYETGRLFLEKYNQQEAAKAFKAALAINPQAAEVHVALGQLALQTYDLDEAQRRADLALEINPRSLGARLIEADVRMAIFQVDEAIEMLDKARDLNPLSEATLGRLAAAYLVADGMPDDLEGTRAGELIATVSERNPHAGEFFHVAAVRLEDRRQFAAAEHFFRQALHRMPQLIGPRSGLGMMYMRLGREEEAREVLEESFEIDPFNVRVSNTLKVLEVLDDYETLETEHFILKFDPEDHLQARYAARHLERIYPKLCEWLGYEPADKSLFEIFRKARNTNGHGWFSARMVGLPYIGTVGACAGKMVAMVSPNDMPRKFNWARVLEHEFVHVINLQQTNNNIPHWFTEALAVWNEGYPRPQDWNELLAARHQKNELFNLDTINFGFIRPQSSDDWTLAYCQAELYAEYIMANHGDGAIARLLDAYADGLNTSEALDQALGVDQDEFERGYRQHLDALVAELSTSGPETKLTLAELERAVAAKPDDADLVAKLAYEQVRRKAYPQARQSAERALRIAPGHPQATYVLARLQILIGDNARAVELLQSVIDPDDPQENVLALLAALRLKAEDYAEAARWYELAARRWPHRTDWTKSLARVYLLSGDEANLRGVLARLAETDGDDVTYRKKLAQMALDRQDYEDAVHWSEQALEIDVLDAEIHRMLAAGHAGCGRYGEAIEEYDVAVELAPDDPSLHFGLADALVQAGQTDRARGVLEKLLEMNPEYPGADVLLESLDP